MCNTAGFIKAGYETGRSICKRVWPVLKSARQPATK